MTYTLKIILQFTRLEAFEMYSENVVSVQNNVKYFRIYLTHFLVSENPFKVSEKFLKSFDIRVPK